MSFRARTRMPRFRPSFRNISNRLMHLLLAVTTITASFVLERIPLAFPPAASASS